MSEYYSGKKPLYRSRKGAILGVCRGLADYLDFPLPIVRLLAVLGLIFTGIWPIVGIYFLAAVLMKPEPVVPFETAGDREFYNSYVSDRSMALYRLKDTYERLDRRIRRMEDIVTAKDYDWESRLNG